MLEGRCHCGEAGWTLKTPPTSITACNCTVCRRYGALWAYGHMGDDIQTDGQTSAYQRRDNGDIHFHFCPNCGCVTHYVASAEGENGRIRAAVNVRLSDPAPISALPIRHFEGLDSFQELPRDGRTVRAMWF